MSAFSNFSGNQKKRIFDRDAWGIATTGMLLACLITSVLLGIFFESGLGKFTDGFTGLLTALFTLFIGAFISYLLIRLTKSLPTFFKTTAGAVLFTLLIFMLFRTDLQVGWLFLLVFVFILMQGFLAGLIWTMLLGKLRFVLPRQKFWARLLFLLIILIDIGVYYFFVSSFQNESTAFTPKLDRNIVTVMPDSSTMFGNSNIRSFYYGSGKDSQRAVYQQGVAFTTNNFDLSAVVPTMTNHFNNIYKWFWGFDASNIPINAKIWMPESDSLQHELVMIVHGDDVVTADLEKGFDYLAEMLSSMGYIVVIPDLNFFNGIWLKMSNPDKILAKTLVLQKHLEVIQKWNKNANHELYNKLDSLSRASIIGHGIGANIARELVALGKSKRLPYNAHIISTSNFNFTKIVELALKKRQGEKITPIRDINHLAIYAGYDALKPTSFNSFISFQDTSQYFFSNTVSIYQANYAQFNETLPGRDLRPPFNWLLNQPAIMSGTMQRDITKKLIAAFMGGEPINKAWLPMMQQPYYIKSLPENTVIYNQFFDNQRHIIASFDEDVNPETTKEPFAKIETQNLKVWRELDVSSNGDDHNKALLLEWQKSGTQNGLEKDIIVSWGMHFSPGYNQSLGLDASSNLIFSMVALGKGENDDETLINDLNFSIEFVDSIGVVNRIAFKNFGQSVVPQRPKLYKVPFLNQQKSNIFYQTYQLPLNKFYALNPDFDLNTLEEIRWVFDRTPSGRILLDNIGFAKNYKKKIEKDDDKLESQR